MTTNMNSDLCLALMHADSAEEVKQTLINLNFWNETKYWRPFGDKENNAGVVGNQQGEAVAALVEKLINSIDARLMNLAAMKNLSPESPDCPQTMRQAIAQLIEGKRAPFGERDGNILYWDKSQIRKEAENICLFATGNRSTEGNPCLTISDSGEGQTPSDFKNTLLSISEGNKLRIPFVQGKYNQGGTGTFQFCRGENKEQLQLVISRRNPALLPSNASATDTHWGFTIVRRVTRLGMRNPMFEYLAPLDGEILTFQASDWPIFPSDDKDKPVAYGKSAPYGTLIKLYEYDCSAAKTNVMFGKKSLQRMIEEALPAAALPIQIAECRADFRGRDRWSFVSEIRGAINQINELDAEGRLKQLETDLPISGVLSVLNSLVPIQVFVFKEDPVSKPYNPKGIFLTINGQTHASYEPAFFTRKSLKLSYIKDSLFVVADCTNIDADIRYDLFMSSRDRIRKGSHSEELEAQLEGFLGEDITLNELNRKRRDERVQRELQDQKPLEETLKRLVKENPLLANLLPFGIAIPTNFPDGGVGISDKFKFEGKHHPTFFRFKGNRNSIERNSPLNQGLHLNFETDAEDDYFSRASLHGVLDVEILHNGTLIKHLGYRIGNLRDGVLTATFDIAGSKPNKGDNFEILIKIEDETLLRPFTNIARIQIVDAAVPHVSVTNGKTSANNSELGESGSTRSAGIPVVTPITQDEWEIEEFDADSSFKIKSNPDGGIDFFYNQDNRHLKYAQQLPKNNANILDHQYKIGLMILSLSIIDADQKRTEEQGPLLGEESDIETVILEITRAISPYWLTILEALASLTVDPLTVSLD